MNTAIKIGLFLILLIINLGSFAQEVEKNDSENELKSRGYLEGQIFQYNEVFIQQAGYNNQAIIAQHSRYGNGNRAVVQQYGQLSIVLLSQSGSSNRASMYQEGNENYIDVVERGNFISSDVFQYGDNNKVQQELGSDGMEYTVIQRGFGHQVIDLGFNPESAGYTIKQAGMVGMTVTIESR